VREVDAAASVEEAAGTIVPVTDTVAGATMPSETEAAPEGTEPTGSASPKAEDGEPKPLPPVTLLLARHAVTEETGSMLSGRKPGIHLSDKGREQAAALGERLRVLPLAAVYASPIERTMQTAEAVAEHHGLAVRELPGVIEADYGGWTGGKLGDLAKEDLWRTVQRAPSRARFPDGESLAEMQVRMVAALETVVTQHPGEIVLVVSHADPIKSAIAHYTGAHLDHFQRIVVSPASVTVFQLSAHGAAMVKCNDTGSLEELVPREREDGAAKQEDGDA
jgi:probable phosphoglycerate mutase